MPEEHRDLAHAVGRRIADARRGAMLTQAQLAARLSWPRDTLIHYEHGRRALTLDRLAAIAAALGLHPATLLIDEPPLAELLQQLVADEALRTQVAFFVGTLRED